MSTENKEKTESAEGGTFDWSMVGFLAGMVVIAVVLGLIFT
jgi:hypothetical protein